ncbi:MAG: carboxypeptidase-like regulatory domain-containing protein, partial [Candidatus Hydrogenedentes bacterium]|nr:carboxypeptidase-like regulatory domain-containing protein [Candidatus Hydrogenedentota bacterium]
MSEQKSFEWNPCRATRSFLRVRSGLSFVLLGAMSVVVSGCAPEVALYGLVTDTAGEALPGVSVKVKGSEVFAVTNGNGMFGERPGRLTLSPGTCELRYIKTGFTTVEQVVSTGDGSSFEVPTVVLWPLPRARGIYDRRGGRYYAWTRVEPVRYLREDRSPVFGTRQLPELSVVGALGRIMAHKVSPYDWRMSRLEKVQVLRDGARGGQNTFDEVWAESLRIPVQVMPVDELERQLWEIRPARALGPGIYAI